MIAVICGRVSASSLLWYERRARCVIDQKRNRIVAALASADIELIIMATCAGLGAKIANRREIIMNRGAPGGCPTSSLYEVAMNSLQSQRLAVGSIVIR